MSIAEMLAAIAIFRKYIHPETLVFHAEHDYLFGPHVDHLVGLTDEDDAALDQLGWHIAGNTAVVVKLGEIKWQYESTSTKPLVFVSI